MASPKRIAAVSVSAGDLEQIRMVMERAKPDLARAWSWVPEAEADVLLIDVDSVYGHMDWLRAQSTGRRVLSLTNRAGGENETVLQRPVTVESVTAAFRALENGGSAGSAAPASTPVAANVAPRAPSPAAAAPAASASPPRATPAPPSHAAAGLAAAAPASTPAAAAPLAAPRAAAPTPAASAPSSAPTPAPVAPTPAAAPVVTEPVVEVKGPIEEGTLLEFCSLDQLPQPSRIVVEQNPSLTLDLANDCYYGPATLKPLIPYCQGMLKRSQWETVSSAVLQGLRGAGGQQPISRLLWLYTLVSSNGALLPGLDVNARYKLAKWPQSEREYPKHFRIATAMMKGPATLSEIADQSGAALADVVDFVNAYSVTGFVEAEGVQPEVAAPAGLLSRLRARAKR